MPISIKDAGEVVIMSKKEVIKCPVCESDNIREEGCCGNYTYVCNKCGYKADRIKFIVKEE